jgi:hypothetical protein
MTGHAGDETKVEILAQDVCVAACYIVAGITRFGFEVVRIVTVSAVLRPPILNVAHLGVGAAENLYLMRGTGLSFCTPAFKRRGVIVTHLTELRGCVDLLIGHCLHIQPSEFTGGDFVLQLMAVLAGDINPFFLWNEIHGFYLANRFIKWEFTGDTVGVVTWIRSGIPVQR